MREHSQCPPTAAAEPPFQPSLWQKLASYLLPQTIERRQTALNPHLEVVLANGRLRLDAAEANYSFGTLHTVLADAFAAFGAGDEAFRDVLILGLGAGSMLHILAENRRDYRITGVEADGEVLRLGRRYFGLREWPGLRIVQQDALAFLAETTERFDLIVIDLFIGLEVPPVVEGADLPKLLRPRLRRGGMMLYNRLYHTAALRRGTDVAEAALAAVFGEVRAHDTLVNRVLMARG